MSDRVKGKGARVFFAALRAAFGALLAEISVQPVVRRQIDDLLDAADAALPDSDGDGVADRYDAAPHDAAVWTEAQLNAAIDVRIAHAFQLDTPAAQGPGVGGFPNGALTAQAPPVDRVRSIESDRANSAGAADETTTTETETGN